MAAAVTDMVGKASRKVHLAGWMTAAGLTALAALSWAGTVYQPLPGARILMFGALALPAVFYVRAIRSADQVNVRAIVAFGALFLVIGFVTLPFDSTDIFYYIAQGWHQSQYDANPYSHLLREVPNHASDPMISVPWNARNMNPWLDLPLPYGFLFASIVHLIARLGNGNWWLTLMLFGILNVSAHIAIAWLVWRLSHILRLGNPKRALFLYMWNPFVLAHFIGDLHNDVLMGLFVVLALYCIASGRPRWVLASLVAGGMIKYIAFALVPFAALAIVRLFGVRVLAIALIAAVLVGALLAAPYLGEIRHFRIELIAGQMTESTGSFHAFALVALRVIGVTTERFPALLPWLSAGLKTALWLAFGIFAFRELRRSAKGRLSPDRIVMQWTKALAFILFFASSQLYPWYIGMLLPLAVLAYDSWVGRAIIAASVAHLLGFTDLRRKGLGYFLLCTLAPFALTWLAARRKMARAEGMNPGAPAISLAPSADRPA